MRKRIASILLVCSLVLTGCSQGEPGDNVSALESEGTVVPVVDEVIDIHLTIDGVEYSVAEQVALDKQIETTILTADLGDVSSDCITDAQIDNRIALTIYTINKEIITAWVDRVEKFCADEGIPFAYNMLLVGSILDIDRNGMSEYTEEKYTQTAYPVVEKEDVIRHLCNKTRDKVLCSDLFLPVDYTTFALLEQYGIEAMVDVVLLTRLHYMHYPLEAYSKRESIDLFDTDMLKSFDFLKRYENTEKYGKREETIALLKNVEDLLHPIKKTLWTYMSADDTTAWTLVNQTIFINGFLDTMLIADSDFTDYRSVKSYKTYVNELKTAIMNNEFWGVNLLNPYMWDTHKDRSFVINNLNTICIETGVYWDYSKKALGWLTEIEKAFKDEGITVRGDTFIDSNGLFVVTLTLVADGTSAADFRPHTIKSTFDGMPVLSVPPVCTADAIPEYTIDRGTPNIAEQLRLDEYTYSYSYARALTNEILNLCVAYEYLTGKSCPVDPVSIWNESKALCIRSDMFLWDSLEVGINSWDDDERYTLGENYINKGNYAIDSSMNVYYKGDLQ